MKRIGLLGCGAIGTQLALAIDAKEFPAVLTHVYDINTDRSKKLASRLKHKPDIVANSHLLSLQPIDIVVEAASQSAVMDAALGILQNRKDLLIMSAGALLDESVFEVLRDACRQFQKTIYMPSGAIAGLDGLKAASGELESVTLITTKHPNSLRGAKFFEDSAVSLDDIAKPTTIFSGTAKEAVSLFPANINVAALLSLAGLGARHTRVDIIADPLTQSNTHKIKAKGAFGEMTIAVQNVPDADNPKTSRLATLSAIRTLQQICTGDIRIGT